MASLFALLSQNSTNLQTRKGLIILGLQNDFMSPNGKLPVTDTKFLDSISELVPAFREFGHVIWVRSEFAATRPVHAVDSIGDVVIAGGSSGMDPALDFSDDEEEDAKEGSDDRRASPKRGKDSAAPTTSIDDRDGPDDEELFLSDSATRGPCCIRGSCGAEYCDEAKSLIQKGKDLEVTKSHYSAFGSTSLLLTLRSKLITDLYLCGCITNLSVYATAMDAARYGIRITLIDDCLGYRRRDRHDAAIKQLRDFMEAEAMDKNTVLERLRNPPEGSEYDYSEASEVSSEDFQHVNMTEPKPVEMKAQEADVDDSEGEVHSPIPSLVNGRRLALRYLSKTSGSPKPLADGRPRVPSFEPSKSTGSRHLSHHSHNITGSWNGQGIETCAPERKSVTSPVELKKRESSRHAIRPCLDTGSRTAPDSQPTSKPTAKMSALTDHPGKIFTYSSVDELSHPTIVEVDGTHQATPAEGEAVTSVNPATRSRPLFGDKNEDESAGSRILFQLLPKPVAKRVFEELRTEVNWQKMYHQNGEVPRLVCCQGTVSTDGSMPVYRHPSDQSVPLQPWTTNVDLVRKAAEDVVGHELNHVLIQLYRGGSDFISEHSDKTLDVVPGSNIVNVSFGAQRTMRLRTKRRVLEGAGEPPPRTAHRVPLPHNSMITMSLATNAEYLHGINADKRQERELAQAEKAYDGERISLTFRQIATFINQNSSLIWGQGASGKTVETARPVINGDPVESEKLVNAFGTENRASSIAWKDAYGEGSDVLHLKNVK